MASLGHLLDDNGQVRDCTRVGTSEFVDGADLPLFFRAVYGLKVEAQQIAWILFAFCLHLF